MARATGDAAVCSGSKHSFREYLLWAAYQAMGPAGKEARLICPQRACSGEEKWVVLTKAWRVLQKKRYRGLGEEGHVEGESICEVCLEKSPAIINTMGMVFVTLNVTWQPKDEDWNAHV